MFGSEKKCSVRSLIVVATSHMRLPNHVLLSLAVLTISALAVHQKNAGPENVELKFKLPPPVPLSPEE